RPSPVPTQYTSSRPKAALLPPEWRDPRIVCALSNAYRSRADILVPGRSSHSLTHSFARRPCLLQYAVMRGRLILIIIRLHIILAHRKILELIPHQNPPQV